MTHPQVRPDPALGLLELYDDALPHVYGYLLARCGDSGLAEDLTAESFLAAAPTTRACHSTSGSLPTDAKRWNGQIPIPNERCLRTSPDSVA